MPTYERFLFAAELLGISPSELAERLGDAQPHPPASSAVESAVGDQAESVALHASYLGKTITAVFERSIGAVTVTSGELAGVKYGSPSRAAIAVVESINPEREAANTNGRLFWIVTKTRLPLRSLLGRR